MFFKQLWAQIRDTVLTQARVVPLIMFVINAAVTFGVAAAAKYGLHLDPAVLVGLIAPLAIGAIGIPLHWQVAQGKLDTSLDATRAYLEQNDIHPSHYAPELGDLDFEGEKEREGTALRE